MLQPNKKTTTTPYYFVSEKSTFNLNDQPSLVILSNEDLKSPKFLAIKYDKNLTPNFLKNHFQVLNPIQATFKILIDKKYSNSLFSSIISTPTSSGKTGIILTYVNHVLNLTKTTDHKTLVVYTAPLKALVREKYEEFRRVFSNYKVEIKTGDNFNSSEPLKADVLTCTTDYLALAFRNKTQFTNHVMAIVIDEVHTVLNVSNRNVLDEILYLIKNKRLNYLVLSATIPLMEELVAYLQPDFVLESSWRPVPQEKRTLSGFRTEANQNTCPLAKSKNCPRLKSTNFCLNNLDNLPYENKLKRKEYLLFVARHLISNLIFLKEKSKLNKVIVFIGYKKDGRILIELLNQHCIVDVLNDPEDLEFEKTEHKQKIKAAFYSAELDLKEKVRLERAFQTDEEFKILITTHSLAYGVNLPADASVVIVSNTKSKDGRINLWPTIIDCIQMGGRAGRFGLSEKGYVDYVITKKQAADQAKYYLENPKEYPYHKILQTLNPKDVIATNVFLNLDYFKNQDPTKNSSFICHLINSSQKKKEDVLNFLISNNFIKKENSSNYQLTLKGELCYYSGISPFALLTFENLTKNFNQLEKNLSLQKDQMTFKFLSSVVLTEEQYKLTFKYFLENVKNYVEKKEKVFSKVNSEERLKLILAYEVPNEAEFLKKVLVFFLSNEAYDSASLGLHASGLYYFLGLPKPLSDLSYLKPSSLVHYARVLVESWQKLRFFTPTEISFFLHALKLKTLPKYYPLILLLKETTSREKNPNKKVFGFDYVRISIVTLALELLLKDLTLTPNLYNLSKYAQTLVENVLNRKEQLFELCERIIKNHVNLRPYFKKRIADKEQIISSNQEAILTTINLLEKNFQKVKNKENHHYLDTVVTEILSLTLNQKRTNREATTEEDKKRHLLNKLIIFESFN